MQLPKRPSVDEKLDLGYEIIEQLLLHRKPLTEEQIDRYTRMWIANRKWHVTYFSMKMAHNALKENLKMLSECTYHNRIPIAVIQKVCMCSIPSVNVYNGITIKAVREKMMDSSVWKDINKDSIPKFRKILEFAIPHLLNENN